MALPEERLPGGSIPVRIMQVPVSGGPPQLVLTALGTTDIHCTRASANLCVFDEQRQGHRVFTSVDPVKGRGREVARMDIEPSMTSAWDLSPDGSRIAVNREGRIRLLSLKSGVATDLTVRGWNSFGEVDWSADGNVLFVSSQMLQDTTLLRVDLRGEARPLWHQKLNFMGTKGIPSPDGRHLAVAGWTTDSNAWMVGELDATGTRLNNTRRLTFDEHPEWPERWTPDSRAVVFWSDRGGSWDIFKQTLDKDAAAELLPLGPEPKYYSSFSPVLYPWWHWNGTYVACFSLQIDGWPSVLPVAECD